MFVQAIFSRHACTFSRRFLNPRKRSRGRLKEGGGGSRKINIKERKKWGRRNQALKGAVGICTISNFWNTWNRQGGRLILAVYGFGGRLMELGIQWCALSITDSVLFSSIIYHLSSLSFIGFAFQHHRGYPPITITYL